MEKFWAVILIFVVVAAAGLMYVNQVYIPQKDTQVEMAKAVNDTLSAVKVEMGDESGTYIYSASEAKNKIRMYYTGGNNIEIMIDGVKYNEELDSIIGHIENNKNYKMEVTRVNGVVTMINFKPV